MSHREETDQNEDPGQRQILFQAVNNHGESSGRPPKIEARLPGKYYGYFQNEYGEQAIFVFDYSTQTGTLWVGDNSWEEPVHVTDGKATDLILARNEQLWLQCCSDTATEIDRK